MSKRLVRRTSAAVLTAALFLGAAGASVAVGSPASASMTPKPDTIVIRNFMYAPMKLKVAPGATITVMNKDSVVHTVSAIGHQFNTGNIKPGKSKTFKAPKRAGTYHYLCAIHQFMTGTLVVK